MKSRRIRPVLACVFAAALVVGAVLPGVVGAQVLGSRFDLNTASVPRSVEIADIDEDGHPDLVVAVQGGDEVSLFLGNGDFTFQPRIDIPTGQDPMALAIADWTGDGNLDLLVGVGGDTTLTVYAGDGTGLFTPGASVRCPTVPADIEVGDVTGDGILDVVVSADEIGFGLFDVPGAPGGGFGAPRVWLADPGAISRSLALAQIDGLPGLDIYFGTQFGPSRILRNDGAGGFFAPIVVSGSGPSLGVTVGDWSGDGVLDAAETSPGTNSMLRLLRGQPGGTFVLDWAVPAANASMAPVIASFDLDGTPDVAFVSFEGNSVNVALAACGYLRKFAAVDLNPADLAVADLDHDGDLDFVTANQSGSSLSLRRNEAVAVPPCQPEVFHSPSAIDFPSLPVGVHTDRTVQVSNFGDGNLLVSASTSTLEFNVETSLPQAVAPGTSLDLIVRSRRHALGTFTDTLRITTNDADEPVLLVPLSTIARAATPPALSYDPSPLVFPVGPLNQPGFATRTVTNTGETNLWISGATFGTGEFSLETPLTLIVPGLSSATLTLRTLRSQLGTAVDTMRAVSNDPSGASIVLPLSAETRELVASPSLIPSILNFGSTLIGWGQTMYVHFQNAGELPYTVISATPPND